MYIRFRKSTTNNNSLKHLHVKSSCIWLCFGWEIGLLLFFLASKLWESFPHTTPISKRSPTGSREDLAVREGSYANFPPLKTSLSNANTCSLRRKGFLLDPFQVGYHTCNFSIPSYLTPSFLLPCWLHEPNKQYRNLGVKLNLTQVPRALVIESMNDCHFWLKQTGLHALGKMALVDHNLPT